jgi:uncharacterized damage-inducible protein DinB
MQRTFALFALAAALPCAALAQPTRPVMATRDPSVDAVRTQWQGMIKNITAAADEMTEADYAFKPVETVRTFGQLIGHVAGTQDLVCAAVLGEPQPAEDAIEKSATTKAALVTALRASTARCERAYAIRTAASVGLVSLFGDRMTRISALTLNAVHDGEHYGNIVTYMRMKGLVPPSSKR